MRALSLIFSFHTSCFVMDEARHSTTEGCIAITGRPFDVCIFIGKKETLL